MTAPTIFLSAASDDLKDWRDILHKAFSRAGCMVFTQNLSLGASAGDVLRLLCQHLDKSDFVIHLAGLAYGAEPEQPAFADHADFKCSYTQFEYYYAHQTGRPVIAFVCGPEFPYLPFTEKAKDDADRERRRALQLAHRERVTNGRFTGTPLDGHPIRPLNETVADASALLQAVAAAVGTIRDFSPTGLSSVQAELNKLATKRHDELLAYIADLPTMVADELERRQLIKPAFELKVDISRIDKYAPAALIGREAETKVLSDAWDQAVCGETKRPHVLTFVALGGEGKTSLVAKWAADLAHQDWPGCEAVFAWSFYSQGTREQTVASSDLFLKEALTFFGDSTVAGSAQGAFDKGRRLAQLVGERRALLILDGLEPLQYAPTSPTPGELKDQGLAALLKGLAAANHGLCVVTTRYSIPDLKAYWQTTAPEQALKRLSTDAGVDLLKKLGVRSGSRKDFEVLVDDVKGHALTLSLIGGFLKRAFKGDIRQRDRVKFEKADDKVQGGHAFRAMAAYEEWLLDGSDEGRREVAILRLMGLFDRPAGAGCIAALRSESIPNLTEPIVGLEDDDWEFSLTGLEDANLLTVNRDAAGALVSLDSHPLLREYFARQLRTQHPEASRAAHRRLYEHLSSTTSEGTHPTLEDLQPLYQAVAHGCQAEMQQEVHDKVWFKRIRQGNAYYSTYVLGAFGAELEAVASFFDLLWSVVSPSLTANDQAVLLNFVAFALRALGRLIEALEPMRAGLENHLEHKNWLDAAITAGNLSELRLTLGEVAGAVGDAERSVTYADRSGHLDRRASKRATLADALHQAGRRAEAEERFRHAEALLAESGYPLLNSVLGFNYCDLLLAAPERLAWQLTLHLPSVPDPSLLPASCRIVFQRAVGTLNLAERSGWPLAIGLDHLTLGRVTLYESILDGAPLDRCQASVQNAVDGLRRAGQRQYLPLGLLTRAWCSFAGTTMHRLLDQEQQAANCATSAQRDLDEAWEIAERGPMPLFMADIHLHRARLFFREERYPWTSPQADLAEARRLIEKHGYLRRMEELKDAERAIKNWSRG